MTVPLDPAVAALAEVATGATPVHEGSPGEARERVRGGHRLCAGGPALYSVQDAVISGEIRARVYRPRPEATGRTLVYFHGGGWVTGDLDYSDQWCRFAAERADCTVVSVDYRLAPENPFPRPLDDAYAALCRVAATVGEGASVGVAGDSAGGNLAAACALRARDEGGPRLKSQTLIYPVLDHDLDRESYRRNARAFPVGIDAMRWFWNHYAPDSSDRDLPLAAPLRSPDLSGLPPAQIVVAGHDPLRDEGIEYARHLTRCGVFVDLAEYPSLPHGFFRFTTAVPAARSAIDEVCAGLARMFAR